MTSLIVLSMAAAYQPYLECEGFQPRTHIEVMQNSEPKNGLPLYSFTMKKKSRGKITEVRGLSAEKIPAKRKQVIEVIAATNHKGIPDYELMVFTKESEDGYLAQLIDKQTTRLVYCSYLVAAE